MTRTRARHRALLTLLSAALLLTAAPALAQTVVVRRVPPGSSVEVVGNAGAPVAAKADANGDAVVTLGTPVANATGDTRVHVFVDRCGDTARVVVADIDLAPSPAGNCARRQIEGVYIVRPRTTLMVSITEPSPTVLIRQGSWTLNPPRNWRRSPTGLMLWGGAGHTSIKDASTRACGLELCAPNDAGFGFNFGIDFWMTPFLGAEISYLRNADATSAGEGTRFRFDSKFKSDVLMVGGKVGLPAGPLRFYGRAGATYTRATITTDQTTDPLTVPATETAPERTLEGGQQLFHIKSAGWGFVYGGGVEIWVAPIAALYGEAGFAGLRGSGAETVDDIDLKDRSRYFMAGLKFTIRR